MTKTKKGEARENLGLPAAILETAQHRESSSVNVREPVRRIYLFSEGGKSQG